MKHLPLRDRIIHRPELKWDLATSKPFVRVSPAKARDDIPVDVDPMRCYWQEENWIFNMATLCETRLPLPIPPLYYRLDLELAWRSNAVTFCVPVTVRGLVQISSVICFSGKRTPIHPALTRHVVAHEYGHAFIWAVAHAVYPDVQPEAAVNKLMRAYAAYRGIDYLASQEAGAWHLDTEEVACDDIRVVLLETEKEFWPHIATFPLQDDALKEKIRLYWEGMLPKLNPE